MTPQGIFHVAGAVLATCLVVEIAVRLPLMGVLREVLETSQRSLRTVTSKNISDHWKERAVLQYSKRLFRASAILLLTLAALGLLLLFILYLGEAIAPGFFSYALGGSGLLIEIVTAVIYLMIRRRVAHA